MSRKQMMSFEEFRSFLEGRFGINGVRFTEVGKHGWTDVADVLDRKPGGTPGPHWCDAAPNPRTQRLLGSYNFVSGEATFFSVWDRAKQVEEQL